MGEKTFYNTSIGYYPYGYNQGTISANRFYVTADMGEKIITNEEFAKMIGFRVTTNKKVKLFY